MADIIQNITQKSYQDFKNRYERYLKENPGTASVIDPRNPLNDPDFKAEAELFKFDPTNPASTAQGPVSNLERLVTPLSSTQIAATKGFTSSKDYFDFLNENVVGKGQAGTDEFARERTPEEIARRNDVELANKALANMRQSAKTVYGIANPIGDGDERYRGFETVMLQDDGTYKAVNMENRSALDRFFGIGEKPLYREQTFNKRTGNFESNPQGRIVTEDELVDRQITQTAPTNVGGQTVTATESVLPSVDTVFMQPKLVDGQRVYDEQGTLITEPRTIANAQMDKPSNVPTAGALSVDAQGNTTPNSQIFALAKFLDDTARRNQGFLGVSPSQFGGFFDDRQTQDRFYGRRPIGFFDDEYFNTAMNMFRQ